MSPRITALWRFLIVVCLVTLIPLVAHAQTCPQPTIDIADPAVCPGSTGHATVLAPSEWIEYTDVSWSIVNGTLPYGNSTSSVTFLATGEGAVELTVTVTDTAACQATNSVTIPLANIPPPGINLNSPSACPGPSPDSMGGYASVAPPPEGITYDSFAWSITNGAIVYGQTSSSASFTIDGTAPAVLTLTVRDSYGCESTNSATVQIRTSPPPEINLNAPSACPGPSPDSMGGYASAAPPPEGTDYQSFAWSITNGAIVYGQTSPSASFTIDGTAPAVLTLTVRDSYGCVSTNSTTVQVRTSPPPGINLNAPTACPGPSPDSMGGYASVAPPPEGTDYQSFAWSITNGAIVYGQTSPSTSFTIDGTAPAVLTLTVRDSYGCVSTNSTTVQVRTIPPPEINLGEPGICPGPLGNYASVVSPPEGTYQSFDWAIVNGTITSGQTSATVFFIAAGTGPVELTLTVRDSYGCVATSTVTVPLGTVPPITIMYPNNCSTTGNRASTDPGFSSITWTVTGGTIVSGQGTNHIDFEGHGGAITVSIAATDSEGCAGTNTVGIPADVQPLELFAPETVCPGSLQKVRADTIMGQNSFNWTVTNATVESGPSLDSVYFRADGTGPVTVSVTGIEWQGCPTSNSITIPIGPMPEPVLRTDYQDLCPGAWASVYVDDPPGDVYGAYQWTLTNAINITEYNSTVWFQHQPGMGDVTVTLNVGEGSCARTATKVIPLRTTLEPILELATTSLCPNGTGVFYIDNYDSFNSVSFSVSNGSIQSVGAGRVPGGRTVTFSSNGNGSMGLHIYAYTPTCELYRVLVPTLLPAFATIDTSGPTTFCEGGSVTLTANAGTSHLWSNGATTQSIVATQSGTYSVTVSQANGCSRTTSRTVTVRPLPGNVITPSGPLSFCQGGNVTLTAPAGSTYLWSTGATTSSINVTSSGSYSVTVTNASGCSTTSKATAVTVNAPPAATITPSGATTFCQGGSVTLSASAGASWLWSNGATAQSINVTASGNYTVTVTGANGCSATSAPTAVTVNAKPSTPAVTASGPTTFCTGGSVTLTAPAGFTYLWSTGATSRSIIVTTSGNYSVTVTNANGCSATSAPKIVTVNARPATPIVTASGPTSFCPGGSVTLTAPAGFTYLWSTGATTRSITANTTGSYSVTVTNVNGCSTTSSATTVTQNPTTVITVQPQSRTIPKNTSTTLSVTAVGAGLSYQWYRGFSGSTVSPVGTNSNQYVTPSLDKGTHRYWVRVTGTCGAVSSITATITAN